MKKRVYFVSKKMSRRRLRSALFRQREILEEEKRALNVFTLDKEWYF
jgi:hypothetical protein